MAKSFTSYKELEKFIKKQVKKSLENEVAEVVKDEIQSRFSEVVYGSYIPKEYKRRGYTDSGLGDKSTMTVELVGDDTIKVAPDAERNTSYEFAGVGYDTSKSLAENIIGGYGNRDYIWNQPRDFIEETKNNLKRNKHHVEALKDSLEKYGVTTK